MYTIKEQLKNGRTRPELRCICIPDLIWNMSVELADEASTSVSALIRLLIKKAYQRNKKKVESAEVE